METEIQSCKNETEIQAAKNGKGKSRLQKEKRKIKAAKMETDSHKKVHVK